MLPVFLLALREGIEAALIVGIILAYLTRTHRDHYRRMVWVGVVSALAASVLVGGLIFQFLGGFDPDVAADKNALRIFEGVACLFAAAVLTWVVLWMHRHARHIGRELRAAVDSAVGRGSGWPLFGLVFLTVGREGLETILILPGLSKGASTGSVAGALVLGLGLALIIGALLHRGSKVLDLAKFFKVTGVLLIFFGAGLVAYGVHELQDAGVFPLVMKDLWDVNHLGHVKGAAECVKGAFSSGHLLHDKEVPGVFLKALFGYNGNPSLIEVVLYFGYLVPALYLFLRPATAPDSKSSKTADSTQSD